MNHRNDGFSFVHVSSFRRSYLYIHTVIMVPSCRLVGMEQSIYVNSLMGHGINLITIDNTEIFFSIKFTLLCDKFIDLYLCCNTFLVLVLVLVLITTSFIVLVSFPSI